MMTLTKRPFPFASLALPWLVFIGTVVLAFGFGTASDFDSHYYISIAKGELETVIKPFSSRFLIPMIAGWLHSLTPNSDLEFAFFILHGLSAIALSILFIVIQRRLILDPYILALSFFSPLMVSTLQEIYLPDLGAMVIVALIIWLIATNQITTALCLLIPAIFIRDSLVLFGVVMICHLVLRKQWRHVIIGCLAITVGLAISSWITRHGPSNVHALNPALYFAMKMPVNFVTNFLGMRVWVDSYQWCTNPFVTMTLPSFVHAGHISAVGLCWADPSATIRNWSIYVLGFGLLPGALFAIRGRLADIGTAWPFAVSLAFSYGVLMTLIGPISGQSIERLIFYGWPAFIIALPAMMSLCRHRIANAKLIVIGIAHITITILWQIEPNLVVPNWPIMAPLAVGLLALFGNVFCYRALRR